MISKKDGILDPLAKAKGFGSAKQGSGHWWLQRLTAIANIPLMIWFMCKVVALIAMPYGDAQVAFDAAHSFVSDPLSTFLLALIVLNVTYHTVLGLQVVIEDYISCKCMKFTFLIALRLGGFFIAALGLYSLLKIAFGG